MVAAVVIQQRLPGREVCPQIGLGLARWDHGIRSHDAWSTLLLNHSRVVIVQIPVGPVSLRQTECVLPC